MKVIRGFEVSFPYEPYELQLNYMEKVIESCETRKYAILESPTGTGKTLSLLCSVLSWNEQHNPKVRIVYSSKTHSQLANVIKELRKTRFTPKLGFLASRSVLCLNDTVKKADASRQSRRCTDMVKSKQCPWRSDGQSDRVLDASSNIYDIEDMIETCRAHGVCPYYCSHTIASKAEIVLTPYTYMIDPSVRSKIPSSIFRKSIIIIDEAHNFPDQCCDYFTKSISSESLQIVYDMYIRLGEQLAQAKISPSMYETVCSRVEEIRAAIAMSTRNLMSSYCEKDAGYMYKLFRAENANEIGMIDHLNTYIYESSSTFDLDYFEVTALENFNDFLSVAFPDMKANPGFIDNHYCVCLTPDSSLNLFCFSPAVAFQKMENDDPWTVIMTSGTIAPFQSFVESMGNVFPLVLENPHVADPSQLMIFLASKGSVPFQFTYQNRENEEMKRNLVSCFMSLFRVAPAGLLSFFPSFSALDDLSGKITAGKQSYKKVMIEPRDNLKLKRVLDEYRDIAPDGAALFAVCRGKMSEGIDFANDHARCVCIVGIPFPNIRDPKVDMHRKWLERKNLGSGSRWYTENAMRAVNQSIGRAIRHKDDYAVVVLFDQRYEGYKQFLSKWMHPSVRMGLSWPVIIREIENFFALHHQANVEPRIEPVREATAEEGIFARRQNVVVAPKPTKAAMAVTQLHSKLDKNERDRLTLILRRFKQDRDINILRDGLESLENEEAKAIVLDVMNTALRDYLLDN